MNTNILQMEFKDINEHNKKYDEMIKKFNLKYGFDSLEKEKQEE